MVIYRDLGVELTAFNVLLTVNLHQYDTAWRLRCLLSYDGKLFPLRAEDTCTFKFRLPDGTPVELQAQQDASNPSAVICSIGPEITEIPGDACGEIHILTPEGRQLVSPTILLRIEKVLIKPDSVK